MRNIKILACLLVLVCSFSACEDEFDELNFDPTVLTDVEVRLMLPEAMVQTVHNEGANQNRVAGMWMQQLFGLDAQQIAYTNYLTGTDVMEAYWSDGLYSGSLRSLAVIQDKAAEDGSTFYSGVAKILMANQYGLAAAAFGDIPFSEALKGTEFIEPSYDSQESVYNGVLAMLDAGIADLGSGAGYAGGDLIFDGDAAKWIATAHALKARYYMHLSKRSAANYSSAMTSLNSAFSSMADQPEFQFGTSETQNWALAKFGIERPSTLGIDARFATMMDTDPRQASYMSSVGGSWQFYEVGNANLLYAQNNSTIPIISYVELKFIEAEALAATGGTAMAVQTALEEAIEASMAQTVLSGAAVDTYVAAESDLTGLSGAQITEKIITEAYKAYYGFNFHETWSNYRRTGYPVLTQVADGSNGFNPSGVVPLRYLYPDSEFQTNATNVEAAQAAQSGGLLDVPVWAFQ